MTTRAQRSRGIQRRGRLVEQSRSRTPLFIAAGIGLLLLLAVAGLAIALSAGSAPQVAQPARSVSIIGEPLPPLAADGADAAIGMAAPTLSGTGLDGQPMSITPGEGPMVVVVLAHWCHFCQAEVPVLVDYLASDSAPAGVEVVALTTAIDPARPNYSPSSWLEREGWTVPTLIDDAGSSGLSTLGVDSFPGFVFINADGQVVQRATGQIGAAAFDAGLRAIAP